MKFSDLGDFKFASASLKNGKICIGSLYFENGRIRLVHKKGPCVELFSSSRLQLMADIPNIKSQYYTFDELEIILKNGKYDFVSAEKTQDIALPFNISLNKKEIPSVFVANQRLIEIEKKKDNCYWVHKSRGIPYLTQELKNNYEELFLAVEECKNKDIEIANNTIKDVAAKYNIITKEVFVLT